MHYPKDVWNIIKSYALGTNIQQILKLHKHLKKMKILKRVYKMLNIHKCQTRIVEINIDFATKNLNSFYSTGKIILPALEYRFYYDYSCPQIMEILEN